MKLGGIGEDSQAPIAKIADINGGSDVTYLFKLAPMKKHWLTFQEEIEANEDDQDELELCKYFTTVISIESLHNIGSKMQKTCGKGREELFGAMPHELKGDQSLGKKKFCVKMPKFGTDDHDHDSEASIQIDHKQSNAFAPYTIDSEIYYDFPILDFNMHVTKVDTMEPDESPADDEVEK